MCQQGSWARHRQPTAPAFGCRNSKAGAGFTSLLAGAVQPCQRAGRRASALSDGSSSAAHQCRLQLPRRMKCSARRAPLGFTPARALPAPRPVPSARHRVATCCTDRGHASLLQTDTGTRCTTLGVASVVDGSPGARGSVSRPPPSFTIVHFSFTDHSQTWADRSTTQQARSAAARGKRGATSARDGSARPPRTCAQLRLLARGETTGAGLPLQSSRQSPRATRIHVLARAPRWQPTCGCDAVALVVVGLTGSCNRACAHSIAGSWLTPRRAQVWRRWPLGVHSGRVQ